MKGTIKLYNSVTNEIEEVPKWRARLILAHNHLKDGRQYCLATEVKNYAVNPPVIRDDTEISGSEPINSMTEAIQEPEIKQRRRRQPKSEA